MKLKLNSPLESVQLILLHKAGQFDRASPIKDLRNLSGEWRIFAPCRCMKVAALKPGFGVRGYGSRQTKWILCPGAT